ncbi:MAG: Rab family GTPase [Candidatus Korarchaeota archaeon]
MPRFLIKIAIAGEGGTGKTTLLHRWVDGVFLSDTRITIGTSFMVKNVSRNGKTFILQIWDLGGEERFRSILKEFVNGAAITLLVFDLSRVETFFRLDEWISLIRNGKCDNIVLVGTKSDLPQMVSDCEIEKIARTYNLLGPFKVSSKTGENVDVLFEYVVNLLSEIYSH